MQYLKKYNFFPNQEEEDELKANIINTYRLTAKKEHTRILQRRQTIEDRKEQLENLNDQRVCFEFSFILYCFII